jgi:hypothetical protein
MPQPGDMVPHAFSVRPGRCFRMVYSAQIQAAHCEGAVVWRGRWRDATGRAHVVEACAEHGPSGAQPVTVAVPVADAPPAASTESVTDTVAVCPEATRMGTPPGLDASSMVVV